MTNYEKILNLIKNNGGYITTKEIVNNNINKMFLTNLVKDKKIIRLSRGYYGLKDYIPDNYYIISMKSKNVIFSLNTALYLHNLINRTALLFNITLPYGYSGSLQKDKNIIINYVKKEIHNLGVEEIYSPFGTKIKVYDIEKTICDIIKNNIDSEIFSEALKNYIKLKNKDLNKLIKYAKKMKIEKKVKEYLKVLL